MFTVGGAAITVGGAVFRVGGAWDPLNGTRDDFFFGGGAFIFSNCE